MSSIIYENNILGVKHLPLSRDGGHFKSETL